MRCLHAPSRCPIHREPLRRGERLGSRFLDFETQKLGALVSGELRVLDLLAKKRKGIIATAVTRGLDPNVKLRDSSVPWLGETPAHWNVTRLKFIVPVQTGIALGKTYAVATIEFAFLRVADVQDGFVDLTEVKTMAVSNREAASAMFRKGDVLMNEGGHADKLGRGAILDGTIRPCLHQNHIFVPRPESVPSEWLSTWTAIGCAKAYFETRGRQSTNLRFFSSTTLMELPIAIPPVDEQHAIVEHIARETEKLDAVRSVTERTIALLKERRSGLIAASATGQLDLGVTDIVNGGADAHRPASRRKLQGFHAARNRLPSRIQFRSRGERHGQDICAQCLGRGRG